MIVCSGSLGYEDGSLNSIIVLILRTIINWGQASIMMMNSATLALHISQNMYIIIVTIVLIHCIYVLYKYICIIVYVGQCACVPYV